MKKLTILIFGRKDDADFERMLVLDERPDAERLVDDELGSDWVLLSSQTADPISAVRINLSLT